MSFITQCACLLGFDNGRSPQSAHSTVRLAIEILEDRYAPANFFWTGKVDALWSNAKNWFDLDTGKVALRAPGMGMMKNEVDIVTFDDRNNIAGKVPDTKRTTIVDKTGYEVGTLMIDTGYGGGVLTLKNNLAVTKTFVMQVNASIVGPGDLILSGGQKKGGQVIPGAKGVWDGGVMRGDNGSGKIVVQQGAELTISRVDPTVATRTALDGFTIENKGTVNLTKAALLQMNNGARVVNLGSASRSGGFTVAEEAEIKVGRNSEIVNRGLFEMTGSAKIVGRDADAVGRFLNAALDLNAGSNPGLFSADTRDGKNVEIAIPFDNSGAVSVRTDKQAGVLRFLSGGVSNGTYETSGNGPAGTVQFAGQGDATPTYTWQEKTKFSSSQFGFNFVNAVVSSKVEIPSGQKVDTGSVTTKVAGMNFVLTGKGEIAGDGNLIVQGASFRWESGTMSGKGTTTISTTTASFGKAGIPNSLVIDGRTVENNTSSTVKDAGIITIKNKGKLINKNDAKLDFQDDSSIQGDGNASFANAGLVIKSDGAGRSTIDKVAFQNTGKLQINSGTLKIPDLTQAQKGALIKAATTMKGGKLDTDGLMRLEGGILENVGPSALTGEVFGDVVNTGGEVHPGGIGEFGILTIDGINGNYSQSKSGSLNLDLASSIPGVGFDQLRVTGTLALGGKLQVNAAANVSGDVFKIIDNQGAGLVAGSFKGLNEGAKVSLGGREFLISYQGGDGNDVVLYAAGNQVPSAGDDVIEIVTLSPTIIPVAVLLSNDIDPAGDVIRVAAVSASSLQGGTVIIDDSGTPGVPGDDKIVYSPPVDFDSPDSFTYWIVDEAGAMSTATVSINFARQSTTTVVESSSPISVYGQVLAFTATVASTWATPTGSVQFFIDGVIAGNPVELAAGTAVLSIDPVGVLFAGLHTVTAVYSGDTDFAPSSGSSTQVINQALTRIEISSTPNPAIVGEPIRFFLFFGPVSPGRGIPTGTITVTDSLNGAPPVVLFSVQLGSPIPQTPLSAGTHVLVATYSGDNNFLFSQSTPYTQILEPSTPSASLNGGSGLSDHDGTNMDLFFSQSEELDFVSV